MNILVTGASGFVGRHLCNFLESKSYNVFRISRKKEIDQNNILELDLLDQNAVINFEKEFKETIDIVIHLASKLANPGQNQAEQLQVLSDNISITNNLVLLIKKLEPKKLINFSSMAVYPNIDGVFDEKSEIKMSENTDCLYGLAKFCGENILNSFLGEQNMIISHLRISQIYGDGMYDNRIIPVMKKELRLENKITLFANGERVSNFINIKKLMEIIDFFVSKDTAGIYNVGDESLSYLQLAQKIIAESGNSKSVITKKEGAKKEKSFAPKFYLNIEKLTKTIKN